MTWLTIVVAEVRILNIRLTQLHLNFRFLENVKKPEWSLIRIFKSYHLTVKTFWYAFLIRVSFWKSSSVQIRLETWYLEDKELLEGLTVADESPLSFEAKVELEGLLAVGWLFFPWDRWPIWSTSVWLIGSSRDFCSGACWKKKVYNYYPQTTQSHSILQSGAPYGVRPARPRSYLDFAK